MIYGSVLLNSSKSTTLKFSISVQNTLRKINKTKKLANFYMQAESNKEVEKQKLASEKIFFEGPPSKVEMIIPFFSILTVIGIIPFITTLLRQFWVKYKITNRRISVDSGFQGKNRAEIVYRDIKKIRYIKRLGGEAADVVLILKKKKI